MRLLALGLPLMIQHCAPTHRETGEAVLIAWPAVMIVAILLLYGYLALWKLRYHELVLPKIAPLALFGVSLAIGAATWINSSNSSHSWAGLAFWVFGASYLSVMLVIARVWLAFDRNYVFIGPQIATSTIFCGVAAFAALDITERWLVDPVAFFLFPGLGGATTLGVLLIGVVEFVIQLVVYRKREARAAATAAPN